MVRLLLLLFSLFCVGLSSTSGGGVVSDDGKVSVSWIVINDTITFTVTGQSTGWVGVGLSNTTGVMKDSDFVLAYNSTGGYLVQDSFSTGYNLPSADTSIGGTDDLENKEYIFSNGAITFSFSRKLVTGDKYDVDIKEGSMYLLFAMGSLRDGVPSYHGDTRYVKNVNFLSKLEYTSPDGVWKASWSFNENVDVINFRLRTTYQGWTGLGISTTGVMDDSDFIVGFIYDNGTVVLADRYENPNAQSGRGRPSLDTDLGGVNDLFDISGLKVAENGVLVTYLNFSRKTDTGDVFDIVIEQKEIYLLWAYGPVNNGEIGKHVSRGSVPMNFEDGVAAPDKYRVDFRFIHATFMMVAWVLLIVPSMMLSRYFKFIARRWFLYHWVLNVVGMLLAYMALIIVLIWLESVPKEPHVIIGLITLGLTLVQGTIGFISNKTWYEGKAPSLWPDKIHWWLGRLIITMALINIFLGMNILQEQSTPFILFATWLAITIVFMIFLELKVGQKNEYEQINEPSPDPAGHYSFKVFIGYWILTLFFSVLSIAFTLKRN